MSNIIAQQLTQTPGAVLCCLCGVQMQPNPANMCLNCLRSQQDITEGVQKLYTITQCKECFKWLQPPKYWTKADLESKELLQICVKKVRGLQKVKLVDAGFLWTEPHSKRLKVKLAIQAEVFNGAVMQQQCVIEYVLHTNMCPDCNKQNTNQDHWIAKVQVRQHVEHKRTFMFLEQLILKHNANSQCANIKDIHEGVDFFFTNRSHAFKFIDFLGQVVPIRNRSDKQLVSHDTHSNSYTFKYTFSVEIAPICKEDLIFLPKSISKQLGGIGPFVLCNRVSNVLQLLDFQKLQVQYLDSKEFFYKYNFRTLMVAKNLYEYEVLDVEPVNFKVNGFQNCGDVQNKYKLVECQVVRVDDYNQVLYTISHLGNILNIGDKVWGYDLKRSNVSNPDLDDYLMKNEIPDVVLVKKSYSDKGHKKRSKNEDRRIRPWKLKGLKMEVDDQAQSKSKIQKEQQRMDMDREKFLEDLEQDPDMQARVNIYKNKYYDKVKNQAKGMDVDNDTENDSQQDGDEAPLIQLDDLLEDLEDLDLSDEEEE